MTFAAAHGATYGSDERHDGDSTEDRTMSEFHFGVGAGRVSAAKAERADRIAKKHGASFVTMKDGDTYRFWFAGPNKGCPFDDRLAADVRADLDAAGITLP